MISIEKAWNEYIEELREDKERDSWYVTDLGRCLRGVYLERQGAEPDTPLDDRTKRLFYVGNLFEDGLVKAIAGKREIETQRSIQFPEFDCRGRLDIFIPEDQHVVEVKTMHSHGFWWRQKSGFQPLPHHKEQLMLYMKKLSEEYPNIQGSLVYISKDDACMMEIPVVIDDKEIDASFAKLKTLNTCWEKQELPPAEKDIIFDEQKKKWQVNWKAKYCNHHVQCTGNPDWLKEAEAEVRRLNKK